MSVKPPVATTIFFGANDAAVFGRRNERQHVPVEEYKENLRNIIHHLKVKKCSFSTSINMLKVPISYAYFLSVK